MVFRLTIWALVLVVIDPRCLSLVGWHAGAHSLQHSLVRWLLMPILLPFFILSAFSVRVGRATDDGADGESQPAIDPDLGLREGPLTRWPAGDATIEAATWLRSGSRSILATARVKVASGFAFSARSARMEPGWMRGFAQGVIRKVVEQKSQSATGAEAETWASMTFLGEAPLDLGGIPNAQDIVLRANQPALAQELFSDAEVARAIGALEQLQRRWEWSLLPTGDAGDALLRFQCPGRVENAEVAAPVQALMNAAIRRLAASGTIEGRAA